MAGRYLVVANQTLGGSQLRNVLRDRIEHGHGRFHVLVPMTEPELEVETWMPADPTFGVPSVSAPTPETIEEARRRSEQRLARILAVIDELGGDAVGEIGSTDPYAATRDLLERETFDEVIVSTLPAGISRWLKMDLPSRIERLSEVPVTTVEAEER